MKSRQKWRHNLDIEWITGCVKFSVIIMNISKNKWNRLWALLLKIHLYRSINNWIKIQLQALPDPNSVLIGFFFVKNRDFHEKWNFWSSNWKCVKPLSPCSSFLSALPLVFSCTVSETAQIGVHSTKPFLSKTQRWWPRDHVKRNIGVVEILSRRGLGANPSPSRVHGGKIFATHVARTAFQRGLHLQSLIRLAVSRMRGKRPWKRV